MAKDDNVNIKLELNKNKNSGKIDIVAHFDNKAPNVIIENNEYFWMPTVEEKDFLNEAFSLVPTNNKSDAFNKESNLSSRTPKKEESLKEQSEKPARDIGEIKESIKKEITAEHAPADVENDANEDNKKQDEEPAVFEVANKDDASQEKNHESDKESKDKEKNVDEAVIVEADSKAIENALKKHQKKNEDDDDSIVEADEKTIIDRVLKQKKKGKWKK